MAAATLVAALILHNDSASAQSTTAFPGTVITVNTTDDESNADGNCSLREAIQAANNNAKVDGCKAGSATKRDAIRFALGEKAKIVLRSTLPAIADPSGLSVNGRKASITISGNDRVRVFRVAAEAELALLNLRVADGSAEAGGGLLNNGTVKVANSTFSNNSAEDGGGINNHSDGTLVVTDSTFSKNSADFFGGGGILNNINGTVKVANSTFSRNSADFLGGGIFNRPDGTLVVTDSTFSNNSAAFGGGINNNSGNMLVKVTDSTFSKNSAEDGGGIDNASSTLVVTDSTFSKNSAEDGGGINNDLDTLKVTNSTFSKNSAGQGGSIFNSFGTAMLRNTIVAYSTPGGNCRGTITDGGYNIDDGTTCGFSEQQDSLPSTDPLLADQPANNGGPTPTIALLEGSPAIDAIPEETNGCGTTISTDQRGVGRPQGAGCDIGAFEVEEAG
jgi:CSLREA domain-containing protein